MQSNYTFDPKEGGKDGDPAQEKRKGVKTSNPMVNTKSKQSHQPPACSPSPQSPQKQKNSPATSNIHSKINVASSLIFSLIYPSLVFQRQYGSHSSSVVSRSPTGLVCLLVVVLVVVVLVDPLTTLSSMCYGRRTNVGRRSWTC